MQTGFHPHASTLGRRHRIHRQLNPVRPRTLILLAVAAPVVALCTAGLGSGPLTALSVLLFGVLLFGAGVAGHMYLAEVTGPDGRHWIAVHDGGLAIRSRHGEPLVLPWSHIRLDETPVDPGEPAVPRLIVRDDTPETEPAGAGRSKPFVDPRRGESRLVAYTDRRRLVAALRAGQPVPPPRLPRPMIAIAAAVVVGLAALTAAPWPGWLHPTIPPEPADSVEDLAAACGGKAYPGSPPYTGAGPHPIQLFMRKSLDFVELEPPLSDLHRDYPPGDPAGVVVVGCVRESLEELKTCGPYFMVDRLTDRVDRRLSTTQVVYRVDYVVTFREVATGEPVGEVVVTAEGDYVCPESVRATGSGRGSIHADSARVEPTREEVFEALVPVLADPDFD